jgi:hypothetical protein
MVYCTVISLPFFAVLLLCLVLYPTIPYSREGKKKGVKRKVRVKAESSLHPAAVKNAAPRSSFSTAAQRLLSFSHCGG